MTRYAVITIEAPLAGGVEEDAAALGVVIERAALTQTPMDLSTMLQAGELRVFGRVSDIRIEDR